MPKAPTAIGTLRHRITIETVTLTPDGQGGSTAAWSTFATVWSRLEVLGATQRLFAGELQTQRTHKITLRYLLGVTTTMRVVYQGRTFQIHGQRDLDERKFYMQLDVEENQGS